MSLVRASFRLRARIRVRVTLVIRRSGRVTPVRAGGLRVRVQGTSVIVVIVGSRCGRRVCRPTPN